MTRLTHMIECSCAAHDCPHREALDKIHTGLLGPYGSDAVAHPPHYTRGKIEVWDFIVDQELSYLRGNVVKYVTRAGHKDPAKELEDLKKARAYLDRDIARLEGRA